MKSGGIDVNFTEEKKKALIEELYKAVVEVKNIEECESFLIDLCTEKEIESLAQRLYVAKLLREDVTYSKIEKETNASTVTISRVSKALKSGREGYKTILDRIGE